MPTPMSLFTLPTASGRHLSGGRSGRARSFGSEAECKLYETRNRSRIQPPLCLSPFAHLFPCRMFSELGIKDSSVIFFFFI